jgi:hypothetical protein
MAADASVMPLSACVVRQDDADGQPEALTCLLHDEMPK